MASTGWNPTSMPRRESELTLLLPDLSPSARRNGDSPQPSAEEEGEE
jgi:hypothetical protein